ncbi:MAG TPA: LPS export ABC transporter ATP-binding protein [Gemmatimonadaceae bacterium]|nr:LPS export ABC transporter ATP-binding protein [Gemmatimonadaceae bacterium]
MTLPDRLFALAKADRTTAGVLASLIEAADSQGRVRLNELAVRVRDQYLALLRQEGRDAEQEAGRLSLDEVRGFLLNSVLPRMADEGLVTPPPPGTTDPDAFVAVAPAIWSGVDVVGSDREKRNSLAQAIRESGGHTHVQVVPEPETGGGGSLLEAEGLVKVYRRRKVVNDVAVRLRQGEIVGMLGPNGAGKTTTFYMIVGLIQPATGRILLDGEDITQMPMYRRARQGIGYLSQEPSIFRKLTVEENILAILEMLPLSGQERRQRLEQLLDELSIKHLRHNKAYSLSGGERRRLEITRALVTSPKFMMLDEPFAGVDPIAVHDIQTIVAGLRHRGIGVLISDHNVEQTLDIVDRAYIMFDGQVKVSGTVRQLVFDETVAEIYLGPTLTARLRARYSAA